jgi:DNA gyrase/topoisomerase IV, subunit A
VLPLVLVNGAEGIGTGWSTTIPNYNPRDVVANLKALLDGRPMAPMQPWYKVRPPCRLNEFTMHPGSAVLDLLDGSQSNIHRMLTSSCCTPGLPGHSPRDRLQDGRQVIRHQRHRLPGALDQNIGHTAVLIPGNCLALQQRARTASDGFCAPPGAAGRADDAGDGAAGAAVDAGLQGVPGGTHQARHQ